MLPLLFSHSANNEIHVATDFIFAAGYKSVYFAVKYVWVLRCFDFQPKIFIPVFFAWQEFTMKKNWFFL